MNERIKELMKESNKDITLGKPFWPALEEFSEKFAELIARDICKIIKSQKIVEPAGGYQDWENGYNASVTHAVEQIKQQYRELK